MVSNTLKEHQMVLTIAIFQKFLISMEVYEISIFFPWKLFKRYSPVQRRSQGNIYIEKFTNIGTSEPRWDISGLFLDDRDKVDNGEQQAVIGSV